MLKMYKILKFANLSYSEQCNYILMKIYSFLKLLNYKIKQYEKTVSKDYKPIIKPIIAVWVEDSDGKPL